jgi:hypothetical protein
MIGRVALLIALAIGAAYADDAVAPKLSAEPPAAADSDAEPAHTLPVHVTVCIDRSARRCWTAGTSEACESFATLPANSSELGPRLRACWKSFD